MNLRAVALPLLLVTLPSPAAFADPGAPTHVKDERKAAQKLFEAGDTLYEAKRYQEAADAFRQSYSLVQSPNSRLMLARCLRELGQIDEAAREFLGTQADAEASGGKYNEALKAAISEYAALNQPGSPNPTPPSPGEPQTEEPSRTSQPLPPIAPARHDSSFAAKTKKRQSQSPLRTGAWIASGVGTAGAVAFTVFAILNKRTFDQLEQQCPNRQCESDPSSRVSTGESYQLAANIGLSALALGATTAVTLFLLSSNTQTSSPTTVKASLGPGSIHLNGHF